MLETKLWQRLETLQPTEPVKWPTQEEAEERVAKDEEILELLTSGAMSQTFVSQTMAAQMSHVKKQLVAQDLNRVKQILSLVEEAVTQELASVE